jgi:hypothetical protein
MLSWSAHNGADIARSLHRSLGNHMFVMMVPMGCAGRVWPQALRCAFMDCGRTARHLGSTAATNQRSDLAVLIWLQAVRTGFQVSARSKAAGSGKKHAEVGQYIADPDATSTVLALPGASADAAEWEYRVRSEVTGQQLSLPFPLATVRVLFGLGIVLMQGLTAHHGPSVGCLDSRQCQPIMPHDMRRRRARRRRAPPTRRRAATPPSQSQQAAARCVITARQQQHNLRHCPGEDRGQCAASAGSVYTVCRA